MERFVVRLETCEMKALSRLAHIERRDFRDQAALIIRQDLEQRGLIAESVPEESPRSEPQTVSEVDYAQR